MSEEERIYVETILKKQVKQHYCTWPGGPGCENLGQEGECCGAFAWRTIEEARVEGELK